MASIDRLSAQLDDIITRVQALTAEERRHLRLLLDRWVDLPPPKDAYEASVQERWKEGLITRLPGPMTEEDIARWEAFRPIKIEGEPLSEQIIRERR